MNSNKGQNVRSMNQNNVDTISINPLEDIKKKLSFYDLKGGVRRPTTGDTRARPSQTNFGSKHDKSPNRSLITHGAQSYKGGTTNNANFFDFSGSRTTNIDSLRAFREKMRDKITKENSSRKNHSFHSHLN